MNSSQGGNINNLAVKGMWSSVCSPDHEFLPEIFGSLGH